MIVHDELTTELRALRARIEKAGSRMRRNQGPEVITFAEGIAAGIPADVLEFATGSESGGPVPMTGIANDAAVRAYMRDFKERDYYRAFRIVVLGDSPADVAEQFSEGSPVRGRRGEVAAMLDRLLGPTRDMR